jgi:hypothetical protein
LVEGLGEIGFRLREEREAAIRKAGKNISFFVWKRR